MEAYYLKTHPLWDRYPEWTPNFHSDRSQYSNLCARGCQGPQSASGSTVPRISSSNLDEIRLLVSERKLNILCASETWLTKDVLDQHIAITEFNVYRCDKSRGGGVCFYVRNSFTVTVINVNIDRIEGIKD